MKEFLKIIVVLTGYFALAPALGIYLSRRRVAERAALCLLLFMPSWFPSKLTLMLGSVEFYRGHTKGFEFSIMVALGIALTVCSFERKPPGFRRMPPGLWLYLLHCFLGCLSLIMAENKSYALMAAWKFTSACMVFCGAFHAFRDETDLRWLLRTLAGALILQALVCLKLRYLEGRWQVHGWFEHQNPLCMWAYLCALPLLAAAFDSKTNRRDTLLFLAALGATALMILLTVSRAGLAAFVVGSAGVTALAFLRGPTLKKLSITGLGACCAVAAGFLALDSLMARIHEDSSRENEEDLRPVLNRQAKAMLQDSPIGIGWNNFGVVNSLPYEKYTAFLMEWDAGRGFRIMDEFYEANPLTESLYWLLLSEIGYPGFVSYIAFMLLTVAWSARGMIRNWGTPLGNFAGAVLLGLLLTYVHGTVERVLSQTKNLSAWLAFSGLVARVELMRRSSPTPARATSRRPSSTPAPPPARPFALPAPPAIASP